MEPAEIRITQTTSAVAAQVGLVQQSHVVCKLYSLSLPFLLKMADSSQVVNNGNVRATS